MACFGSLVLSILSRWLIQFCLYLSLTSCIPEISSSFLMTSLLILPSLVYPVTLLRKRFSAASRRIMSFLLGMRNVSDKKLYRKSKHTFCVRWRFIENRTYYLSYSGFKSRPSFSMTLYFQLFSSIVLTPAAVDTFHVSKINSFSLQQGRKLFRSISEISWTQILFRGRVVTPTPNPPTWRTRVSLFVWVITFDLSGLGDPASSYATAGLALRIQTVCSEST